MVNKRNHYFTASNLTPGWKTIKLLKEHFLYYLSHTAAGNKAPLKASYRFLCGCGWCVVHTAIMMSQTSISTKNFTTLLWAWLGNGSALYCMLFCWLRESLPWELGWLRSMVGWKGEVLPGLSALGLEMWEWVQRGSGHRAKATGRDDGKFNKTKWLNAL